MLQAIIIKHQIRKYKHILLEARNTSKSNLTQVNHLTIQTSTTEQREKNKINNTTLFRK